MPDLNELEVAMKFITSSNNENRFHLYDLSIPEGWAYGRHKRPNMQVWTICETLKVCFLIIKSYLEMPDLNELEVAVKFITSSNN